MGHFDVRVPSALTVICHCFLQLFHTFLTFAGSSLSRGDVQARLKERRRRSARLLCLLWLTGLCQAGKWRSGPASDPPRLMFITVTLTYLTATSSSSSKKQRPDIWREKKTKPILVRHEANKNALCWKRKASYWGALMARLIGVVYRGRAHLLTECLQSACTAIKANVSTWTRHRLMVVSRRSLLCRCLVRGERKRQWPEVKVSSEPVPIWGPSACQSHILITNIIWIYTNEYKWLPGLHKLRVINCFCR